MYTTELFETKLPKFLTDMTTLLKENNGGKGFFVGNKVRCILDKKTLGIYHLSFI